MAGRAFWMLTTGVPINTGEDLPPADDSTMRFMNWILCLAIAAPILGVAAVCLIVWLS